jgi:hypothetical protein
VPCCQLGSIFHLVLRANCTRGIVPPASSFVRCHVPRNSAPNGSSPIAVGRLQQASSLSPCRTIPGPPSWRNTFLHHCWRRAELMLSAFFAATLPRPTAQMCVHRPREMPRQHLTIGDLLCTAYFYFSPFFLLTATHTGRCPFGRHR